MMARSQEEQSELKKGSWDSEEDEKLTEYMKTHGDSRRWKGVPKAAGLNRCSKSCRMRRTNYLRPGIKKGNISTDEEDAISKYHLNLGKRWSYIAAQLGRTENEIKNYWYTRLKKKVGRKDKVLLELHPDAFTENPQLHGLCFNPILPAQTLPSLPPQGLSHFNYQAMKEAAQTLFSLPPQEPGHFNYQAMEDRVQTSLSSLPPQGPGSFNYPAIEDPAPTLFSLPPQGPGHFNNQVMEDPVQTLSSLPPQGPGCFNYPSMEDLQFNNNHREVHSSLFPNIIPNAWVSEFSMSNHQVEKEITLAQEEIAVEKLILGNEINVDSFYRDLALALQ